MLPQKLHLERKLVGEEPVIAIEVLEEFAPGALAARLARKPGPWRSVRTTRTMLGCSHA
jgi:hypothetical protein